MKKHLSALEVVSASSLMAGAQTALIQTLIRKNLISAQEGREIYEQALLLLETSQTISSSQAVFEAAREMIEPHLHGRQSSGQTRRRSARTFRARAAADRITLLELRAQGFDISIG